MGGGGSLDQGWAAGGEKHMCLGGELDRTR